MSGAGKGAAAPPAVVNHVTLVGRLAAEPSVRELPSGDEIATFRLVVDRPQGRGRGSERSAGRRSVDTLDCVAWRADVRRRLHSVPLGSVLSVEGSVRRRFWRPAGGGPTSRVEIEVDRMRRVAGPP